MFNAVKVFLENLAANRADGDTTFTYLSSFEFVFMLCMMREILETSEDLGKALQKKAQGTGHSKCCSLSEINKSAPGTNENR